MRTFSIISLAALVLFQAMIANAANPVKSNDNPVATASWPQWRGPLRDGKSTETGLRKNWDGGLKLLWDAEGFGAGYSTPTIADGKIYTMGDRDGSEYVFAAELNGGKIIWEARVGASGNAKNGGYPGPRCSPTIDGKFIYALGSNGDLVCLTLAGKDVWRKSLMKDFGGKMMSHWGYSESPLIDGEKIIVTPGGYENTIVALNKKDGKKIWHCKINDIGRMGQDGAAYSSCVVANCAGVRQYVQLIGRGLVGVDAENGALLWSNNHVAGKVANVPTPIVRDDYVFGTTGYKPGGAVLLKIEKGEAGKLKANEVYFLEADEFRNHHGGMILLDDHLYGGDGQKQGFPTCIEFLTGKKTWSQREKIKGAGTGSAAVTYADGNFYFRYEDGTLALISADPDKYKVVSTFKLPRVGREPSWPHPVILDGKLYIRDQEHLFCYDLREAP